MTEAVPIGTEKVLADIHEKRRRQVVVHGHKRQFDDAYKDHELASAAIAYTQAAIPEALGLTSEELYVFWPTEWVLPNFAQNPRELLINAAALLVAEIERIDREKGRQE
jgi:hypothetical protein